MKNIKKVLIIVLMTMVLTTGLEMKKQRKFIQKTYYVSQQKKKL